MISCTASRDGDGFFQALCKVGEASLTPEVIGFLARYCIALSPPWLPNLAEDLNVEFHDAGAPHVGGYVKNLLRECRREDEAGMERALDALLDGVDDSEGAHRAALLMRHLSIIAIVLEKQAERSGVSVAGREGPHGLRLPF
ncbi:MAG TPA: hypothetical protein DGT23_00845 [Micromonosporaceae bacterium]|nr:hypothetical protein [Micromonosporaceae bacterium]